MRGRSPERDDLVRRLADQGLSYNRIGEAIGVSGTRAFQICRELGIVKRSATHTYRPSSRVPRILELTDRGLPQCVIAERLSISRAAVSCALLRAGRRTRRGGAGP